MSEANERLFLFGGPLWIAIEVPPCGTEMAILIKSLQGFKSCVVAPTPGCIGGHSY